MRCPQGVNKISIKFRKNTLATIRTPLDKSQKIMRKEKKKEKSKSSQTDTREKSFYPFKLQSL